jgi:hypothetical protein
VYVSFDIDAVDPAFAPGTGTPEAGGLTSYEALALVRGLRGLDFVGFDLVEVAPEYDGPGQVTAARREPAVRVPLAARPEPGGRAPGLARRVPGAPAARYPQPGRAGRASGSPARTAHARRRR